MIKTRLNFAADFLQKSNSKPKVNLQMSRFIAHLKLFKKRAARVLSVLKHSAMPLVLNPIKHRCSFLNIKLKNTS